MSENRDIKSSGEERSLGGYLEKLASGGVSTPPSREGFVEAFGRERPENKDTSEEEFFPKKGFSRLNEVEARKRSWWKGPMGCVIGLVAITTCCVITYYSTQISVQKLFEWRNLEKPAISEPITFDRQGRDIRYEYYLTDNNTTNDTLAERWRSGDWGEYTTQDLINNLNPANPYNNLLGFGEWCPEGPIGCFTDPAYIPKEGKQAVADLLGLTLTEYDKYYQNHGNSDYKLTHPEEWKIIINRMHQKYDSSQNPWLAPLFEISPTTLDSQDQSDFEKWIHNKWDTQGFNLDTQTTKKRIHQVGFQKWKNPQRGYALAQRQKGFIRGTKGFS